MANAPTTTEIGRAARLSGKGRPPHLVPPANMPWADAKASALFLSSRSYAHVPIFWATAIAAFQTPCKIDDMPHFLCRMIQTCLLTVLLLPTAPLLACAFNLTPRDRAHQSFDAVFVGKIVAADYKQNIGRRSRPWQAIASIQRPAGETWWNLYRGNDDCDDGQPLPKVGDPWVLYLQRIGGRLVAVHSMPLVQARREDPRFGGAPYPDRAQQQRRAREIRKIDAILDARKTWSSAVRPRP